MNEERYGARAVVAKDNIYVAGGTGGRYVAVGRNSQTVEFIPTHGENPRWTLAKARMNGKRACFGLVWFNKGLFAVGGWDHEARRNRSTEWLKDANPEGEWEEDIPMQERVVLFGDLILL